MVLTPDVPHPQTIPYALATVLFHNPDKTTATVLLHSIHIWKLADTEIQF